MRSFRFPRWLGKILRYRMTVPIPGLNRIFACLSILGVTALSYVAGAAVMHFDLPSADYLRNAFTGGFAWQQRGQEETIDRPTSSRSESGLFIDQPGKTFDGYTLITTNDACKACLIDMKGNAIHSWEMPFSKAWPTALHVRNPVPDKSIHWFRTHLYPNGDLLAIYQSDVDSPAGYGLVKLDKESNLLWKLSDRVHHDIDVDEDGTIYTLVHHTIRESSPTLFHGLFPTPFITDDVVMLSPDGQVKETLAVPEAFLNSDFSTLFTLAVGDYLGANPAYLGIPTTPGPHREPAPSAHLFEQDPLVSRSPENLVQNRRKIVITKGDSLHTNSIKVLTHSLAKHSPFTAGQVLISMRELDMIAVLDLKRKVVVWAAQGLWRHQHDPDFLENGRLQLFDNLGNGLASRVIEYDPATRAITWSYTNENSAPFYAMARGMKQHLGNDNLLMVAPNDGLLLEVTRGKELVWKFGVSNFSSPDRIAVVTGAQRFTAKEVPFLHGSCSPRPPVH